MPLLRRTSSSRKAQENKSDSIKKCRVKPSQDILKSAVLKVNGAETGTEVHTKNWIKNSFFNDTQKSPEKWTTDQPHGKISVIGDVNSNVHESVELNNQTLVTNSSSLGGKIKKDEAKTKHDHNYLKKRNCSTNSGLCTSTPKSKEKKSLKKCMSPPLDQFEMNKCPLEHKSFDESDSLFADLDISGECQEEKVTETNSVHKLGHKRKVSVSDSSQLSTCDRIPSKRQAKEAELRLSSDIVIPSANLSHEMKSSSLSISSGHGFADTKRASIVGEERQDSVHSGKMSEGVEDMRSDAMSFCDNDMSDFDIFFPSSDTIFNTDIDMKQNSEKLTKDNSDDNFYKHSLSSPNTKNSMPDIPDSILNSCVKPVSHLSSVPSGPDVSKTPHSTNSLSLKERLKQNLHKNAKMATPQTRSRLLQEVNLEEVRKDVKMLLDTGSEFDLGPFYGLPTKVKELFESQRGISKLYDWQHECLSLDALRRGCNLIYSLPTSGGKTLVAEILILRELLCKKRDTMLVLPFVSIVQEKVRGLSAFSVELDFLVEEYAGSKGGFPPKKRRKKRSLYIATIEKANSLVNSLIEEGRIDSLGLCVIDELHMLGEGAGRGATLEMCLTKLMHCTENTQIIGMSATLNNIKDLEIFLNAELYTNDFRPVELKEYVKMEDMIYSIHPRALCPDDKLKHSRVVTFKYDSDRTKKDPDHLAGLVLEIVPHHSCLVFCPTKKNCENVADLICRLSPRELTLHKKAEKKLLLSTLSGDGGGQVCPVLRRTVPYGVAYHHSGLTMDERRGLEEAYSEGTLCVLCCTSTLAAGVNLPAKRVVLRSPYVGESFLSRSQYKQMVGRAGRAGIDSSGESILVMQKKDRTKLLELVSGPCDSCHSSLLYMDGKGMRALLLTTIGLEVTDSRESVSEFVRRTLCFVQTQEPDRQNFTETAHTAVQQLIELKLVSERSSKTEEGSQTKGQLSVTALGKAVFKGSVDTDRGSQLYSDLCQAREALCVANYLHLLYLVTPYDLVDQVRPSWITYLDQVSGFSESEQRVASVIGVTESYLSRKASGQRIRKVSDDFVVKRFYLTLVLYHLWGQRSVWSVAHTFSLPRGFVQQLLNGAAAFASCVTRFCQELDDFWAYQDLLQNFVKKLSYCVTMELIPLMEIPGVKIGRARQLYSADYKSLQQVAHANPEALVREIEHMPRKAAKQIVTAAKMLLQERVESLMEEVDDMMGSSLLEETEALTSAAQTGGQEVAHSQLSQASTATTWGDMPASQ